MKPADLKAPVSKVTLGIGSVPEPDSRKSAVVMELNGADLRSFLQKARQLKPEQRPDLKGVTCSTDEERPSKLTLIFDIPGAKQQLLIQTRIVGSEPSPSVSEVWPYASWWEEELRVFEGLRFEGEAMAGSAKWQQS